MGKNLKKNNKTGPVQLSRKQKRKLLRKDKKVKKDKFYKEKSHQYIDHKFNNRIINSNNKVEAKQTINSNTQSILKKSQTNNNPIKKIISKNQTKKLNQASNVNPKLKKNIKKVQLQQQLLRQQKQIQFYQKLLGVNKKKNQYKNIAKGLGYEDDLFDFLDGISKKVKEGNQYKDNTQNDNEMNQHQISDEQGIQDFNRMDDEFQNELQIDNQNQSEENYDENQNQQLMSNQNDQNQINWQGQQDQQNSQQMLNSQYSEQNYNQNQINSQMDSQQKAIWQELDNQGHNTDQNLLRKNKANFNSNNDKVKIQNPKNGNSALQNIKKLTNSKQQKQIKIQNSSNSSNALIKQQRPQLFGNISQQQKQQQQIRKQMNSIFNKLSDGNLMISFRQFSEIFLSSSKSNTIPVFINLFIRFNVQIQKPHLHILLSNIALASALHHLIGNRFMAPLIYDILKIFEKYQQTQQNVEQIQQIGYSKLFEKKKNIIIIISYLYDFGSLTGDFIYSLVKNLANQLNEHHVEFLYVIIQKIGSKIRQNDPGILKQIIDTLRQSIQNFKNSGIHKQNELSKINIIQIELNQLKFNRKQPLFSDQRMAFFSTFLTKNIPNELNTQKQILLANYDQIIKADTTYTNWWQNLSLGNKEKNQNNNEDNQDIQLMHQLTSQRKQLIQLAKSLNLVTQIRKNIFVQIMESSDYIEATQKILALKIRNLQQISIVLVQACILQPTFNPFYPLVAAKIANINPKFKSKVQFTIWDNIKLLQQFNPRKTSNLAKFTARFIGSPLTNGSLSILKYFTDFINIPPHQAMFLMIFFSEFLSITKKQTIVQICTKLKQESNRQIKESILEYLNEVGARQKGFNNIQKMKFLRRMIMVNEEQNQNEQRY